MFSVGASGGAPPPHERMIRRRSTIVASTAATLAVTSSGVPRASTSRGGMLPKSVDRPAGDLADLARGCG